jgi:hypothetical protein
MLKKMHQHCYGNRRNKDIIFFALLDRMIILKKGKERRMRKIDHDLQNTFLRVRCDIRDVRTGHEMEEIQYQIT